MGPQVVRDQPLAGPLQRSRRSVVQRKLSLGRQKRRPPAGPGRELDDLPGDGQPIQPTPGHVELGVPGRIVDRAACVPAPAQVPVVVLGRASFVVREHLSADVGDDHIRGRCLAHTRGRGLDLAASRGRRDRTGVGRRPTIVFRRSPALRQGLAEPEPQEAVVAGLADALRTQLRPTFQIVGASRDVGGPAPQTIEAGAEGHGAGPPRPRVGPASTTRRAQRRRRCRDRRSPPGARYRR